ncbi:M20 family metallopeptidase [Rhodococcus sp. NPDC056960]|uniref:M20 metallopeptidase family protein n=1 Tax=Rhodococcus sp. NPDC056960 TaxID=3345982 RepID=UPI0036292AAC
MTFFPEALELTGDLISLRHALHREPERGLHLPQTQSKVLAALDGLPLEVHTGSELTSVTAVLRGERPGPVVLLRGDMDALPLHEESGVEYTSEIDGAMHACGHDLHTAMLVGSARLLARRISELPGSVIFMFQPGEEGFNGAARMIEEGVLEAAGEPPVAAYAVHVTSSRLPIGKFTARPGTMSASETTIEVTVRGKGGHSSRPHTAADPIPVAAEMVTAAQIQITRTTDVFDPVVFTVGTFHAGTAVNAIPETASFAGSLRTCSEKNWRAVPERLEALFEGIAAAHGLSVEVTIHAGYPAVVNEADAIDLAGRVASHISGDDGWGIDEHPIMGSEDFSWVLQKIPGAMVSLGARPAGADTSAPTNHSTKAVFDDAALPYGAAFMADMAWERLQLG